MKAPEAVKRNVLSQNKLTVISLFFWWLHKFEEFHIDMNLNPQNEANFKQHQLELTDTWKRHEHLRRAVMHGGCEVRNTKTEHKSTFIPVAISFFFQIRHQTALTA